MLQYIRRRLGKLRPYRISTHAASASFFLITSLLPLIMLVLSILSWIGLDVDAGVYDGFSALLPTALQGILDLIVQNVRDVGAAELSISVVALFWSASKGMIGLVDGLNDIAGNEDRRNFIFKRLVCLLYMAVLIVGLLLTLGLRVFGHTLLSLLQKYLPPVGDIFAQAMDFRGLTLYLAITLIIALIYSLFPNKKMPFVRQLPGAALASAAWLIFSAGYSLYIEYAASASAIYSGIGILVLAMLWVYFCIYIVFVGAVINKMYPDLILRLWAAVSALGRKRFSGRKGRGTHQDQ